jgi:sulfatase maturation enzyme AslB (radical SAM superfamily)
LQESLNEAKDKQVPLDVHFTKEDVDSMTDLITCMNKPVKRRFKVIETAFSCQTLEGITHGKAGDCLVVGVDGEIYPCDKEIFDNTYVALEADKIQEEFLNANKRLLEAKEIIEKAEQAYIIGKLTNNC